MYKTLLIIIACLLCLLTGFLIGKEVCGANRFYFNSTHNTPYLFDTQNGTIYAKRNHKIEKINYKEDFERQINKNK